MFKLHQLLHLIIDINYLNGCILNLLNNMNLNLVQEQVQLYNQFGGIIQKILMLIIMKIQNLYLVIHF